MNSLRDGAALWLLLLVMGCGRPEPSTTPEALRIEGHLDRVSHELRTTPTPSLSLRQRSARAETIEWLDEYRAAGSFPHNHVLPGERIPVFVDPHGTPCAVGYLLLRSGEHELVETIVRTDNLVRVSELEDDGRFRDWLEERGLSLEEAGAIQPAYDGMGPRPGEATRTSNMAEATVGLSILTAAVASYAAMTPPHSGSPWVEVLGIGTSLGHSWLLLEGQDEPSWTTGVNVAGVLAGLTVAVFGMIEDEDLETTRGQGASLSSYVAAGAHGTEVGLAIRH